ncbi:MAG TPA: response regulator [Gemmataceae bacterium]|nr:response regulator [Gemmataceae bacterium]
MPPTADAAETILIVDDEEPVRKTFREWLESAHLGCRILTAADAEAALVQANQHTIDLAILDWNLGAGNDGLHLLEDLYLFNPDVVAIMITGYAHQATPLDAMRMGVRDYFDKNQDLNRETFLRAVTRQLDRIRPAKRERRLHQSLVAFREAVEKVLPLVQSAAALNDPVSLPEAIGSLFRFLMRTTGARDGVLLVRSYDADRQPAEVCRAYDAAGNLLNVELVPFARSLAGTVVSLQEPFALGRLQQETANVELQPFERDRQSLLAAPLAVAPGLHVVLELFDKQPPSPPTPLPLEGARDESIPPPQEERDENIPPPLWGERGESIPPLAPEGGERGRDEGGFTEDDRRLVAAAAEFGAEMLRQELAGRQTHRVLLDAVAAALGASDSVAASLRGSAARRMEEPPPAAVMDQLREGLRAQPGAPVAAEDALRLAEAVRVLALRHGPAAVRHCIGLVESLRGLLDEISGAGEARP